LDADEEGARTLNPRNVSRPTRIKLGVDVVVRDREGRVLLEKRKDCGLWGLPGGRLDPGESVTQAGIREVNEETGFTIRVDRLIGVYSTPTPDRLIHYPEGLTHSIDVVLEGTILHGTLTHSDESEAVAFHEPTALPPDMHPAAQQVIEDLLRGVACHID
jgi:ADP-ribose pyrophosphatase YjhB (NUDIX family)